VFAQYVTELLNSFAVLKWGPNR